MRVEGVIVSTQSVVVDATSFPVVLASFHGAPARAELTAFLDGCSLVLCREEPFVMIVDAREGGMLPYEQVLDAASWLSCEGERRRQFCRGLALVLPSAVQRAVLAAVMRVSSVGPHAVFDAVPAAVSWALQQLAVPRRA